MIPLTPEQMAKACKNNPIYRQQLGATWLGYKVSDADVASVEFAEAAYNFQVQQQLTADAMWGPGTNKVAGTITLTPEQVAYAVQRNPYWMHELGSQWAGGLISAQDAGSPLFAEDVYTFQVTNDLATDGICGPETNALAAGGEYVPPAGTEYLLISGAHVPCDFKVVSPDEDGAMVFTKNFYVTPLLTPTLFVLHWDGCKSSRSCYEVLLQRGLSVQFMLDADGTVYQGIDPGTGTCWHAGSVNRRAWGVEICNPVYLNRQNPNHPRPITTMGVRGDKTKILGFYPEQLDAVIKLCHWVCEYTGIPKQLPSHNGSVGVYNSYIRGPGDAWQVNGFTGVCGHFHQDDNKCDPGMDLWQPLINSGFKVVPV
jgi:hypothetical protein